MGSKRWAAVTLGIFSWALFSGIAVAKPAILGIAPFSVSPESGRAYMEPALMELFASRLALKKSVRVVERSVMTEAFNNGAKDPLERLMTAGRKVQADYILTGSLTLSDAAMTLNAYVLDIGTGKPVIEFSEKSDPNGSKTDIIPLVDQAAAQINARLFSRKAPEAEAPAPAPSVAPLTSHAHPDKLLESLPEQKK